jgi:hypothetical protein
MKKLLILSIALISLGLVAPVVTEARYPNYAFGGSYNYNDGYYDTYRYNSSGYYGYQKYNYSNYGSYYKNYYGGNYAFSGGYRSSFGRIW